MVNKYKYLGIPVVIAFLALISFSFDSSETIRAEVSDDERCFGGYARSGNIGRIDLNPNGHSCVKVESDGNVTGYAWSDAVGWINMDPAGGTPSSPGYSVRYDNDDNDDNDDSKITGWARACSVYASTDSCSGALKDEQELGGWSGWIRMHDVNVSSEFVEEGNHKYQPLEGWAWGDLVVGWVDFSGVRLYEGDVPPELSVRVVDEFDNDNYVSVSVGNDEEQEVRSGDGFFSFDDDIQHGSEVKLEAHGENQSDVSWSGYGTDGCEYGDSECEFNIEEGSTYQITATFSGDPSPGNGNGSDTEEHELTVSVVVGAGPVEVVIGDESMGKIKDGLSNFDVVVDDNVDLTSESEEAVNWSPDFSISGSEDGNEFSFLMPNRDVSVGVGISEDEDDNGNGNGDPGGITLEPGTVEDDNVAIIGCNPPVVIPSRYTPGVLTLPNDGDNPFNCSEIGEDGEFVIYRVENNRDEEVEMTASIDSRNFRLGLGDQDDGMGISLSGEQITIPAGEERSVYLIIDTLISTGSEGKGIEMNFEFDRESATRTLRFINHDVVEVED